ncbi:hypothetical protein [Pseudomonas sp. NPDC089734]
MGREIMAAPEQAADYKRHRRLQKLGRIGFVQESGIFENDALSVRG